MGECDYVLVDLKTRCLSETLSWDTAVAKVLDLFEGETAGLVVNALLQLPESTRLGYFLPADAATKSALESLVRCRLSWDTAVAKVLELFEGETAGTIVGALLQLPESTRLGYILPRDAATKSALESLVSRKRPRLDVFGKMKDRASALASSLEASYGTMTEDMLGSTDTQVNLLAPDILADDDDARAFSYMGRKLTLQILNFFQSEKKGPVVYRTNRSLAIRFITGTPGAGKTYSVAAAAGYLYVREQRKDAAAAVAYINSGAFMADPPYSIWCALILAYIHDEAALSALMGVDYKRQDSLLKFLSARKKVQKVYLIFGNGNSLDDKDVFSAQTRFSAWAFVESLAQVCVVVVSASILQSKLRRELIKDSAPPHFIVSGGYTRQELVACIGMYLETTDQKVIDEEIACILPRTGSVPRLVYQHYYGSEGELNSAIGLFKDDIRDFIVNRSARDVDEVGKALRGETVDVLTVAMDARAFYRGRDGTGQCLTGDLRSYALGLFAERLKVGSVEEGKVEVRKWVGRVVNDKNLVRIGWNAEEATILALKLLMPCIRVDNRDLIRIKPAAVRTITGRFGIADLDAEEGSPTLFTPATFNHIGAEVYYSDEECLIIFQIAVANNPEKHHGRTLEVADEMFRTVAKRRTMLVWVVYTPTETDMRVFRDSEHPRVTQVFMSFAQLCSDLKDIDSTLRLLKGDRYSRRPAEEVCPACKYAETCRDDTWISCTHCNTWFHWACTAVTQEAWESWLCKNCRAPDDDPDVAQSQTPPVTGLMRRGTFRVGQ